MASPILSFFQMSITDLLTVTPTLAIMSLFALYREEVFCLWGCNPQINALVTTTKVSSQVLLIAIQTQLRSFMAHAMYWISSTSDVSKHVLFQWLQTTLARVQRIDHATLTLCLYITYTLAFAVTIYVGIVTHRPVRQDGAERQAPPKMKKRVPSPYPVPSTTYRPITRSMTRNRLNKNV